MHQGHLLSSLRARIILLILFALVPAFGILIYNTVETREREIAQARADVLSLSRLAAIQQEQVVESARQVLISLAALPEVQNGDSTACSARFLGLNTQYQNYTGLGVADPKGNIWCQASATPVSASIATRPSFQLAVASGDFAVGTYQLGRSSGKPALSVCYPIQSSSGSLASVICAGVDLTRLNDTASEAPLPQGATLLVIDREGTVLVHAPSPELMGQPLPNETLRHAMLGQTEGALDLQDMDGIQRIYAFNAIHSTADTGLRLAVGIPTEIAFAAINQRLIRDLLLMGVVALLCIILAWYGSSRAVLRPVRALVSVSDRLGQGDLSARAKLPSTEGEIGQLSHSFNLMATALEQRQTEQRRAEQALQAQREWLKITLASIGDAVIATDMQGRITLMNPVAQSLTGWSEETALGQPLNDIFRIVNAKTRLPANNPVDRVIREGVIVGLANHTRLITKQGTEVPIDDSAAPIKDETGKLAGVVLIFRDISEREQAEEELRISRDQLNIVLQGAADGIIAQDRVGGLRFVNEAAARRIGFPSVKALLDAPRSEINRRFEIYDEAGQRVPNDRLPGRLVLGGAAQASAVLRYRNLDTGEERWSADQSTAIFDDQGQVEMAVNILHDITELKSVERSQRVLAEAGRLLSASLDAPTRLTNLVQMIIPTLADWCAVDVAGPDNTIQRVAVAHIDPAKVALAHELQGRYPVNVDSPTGVPHVLRSGTSEYYPSLSLETILASAQSDEQRELIRDLKLRSIMIVPLLAHGRTLGALSFVWAESGQQYSPADLALAEELGRRAGLALDNAVLYEQMQQLNTELEQRIAERTSQLETSNGLLLAEIAERRQAHRRLEESQAQLRQLSAHLQAAREEERAHIAREIHDELGQVLTTLKMDLASMQRLVLNPTDAIRERMMIMSQSIDSTVQMVRRLATELRPSILDDLGLAAAIEWQMTEFQQRTGIRCELEMNIDESSVGPQARIALFRIFQETLTNVARHAQATLIKIRVEEGSHQVLLQVKDNGRGITETDIAKSRSFGVLGMRERVHLLNGEFNIEGKPGEGTTVTVRLNRDGASDEGGVEG